MTRSLEGAQWRQAERPADARAGIGSEFTSPPVTLYGLVKLLGRHRHEGQAEEKASSGTLAEIRMQGQRASLASNRGGKVELREAKWSSGGVVTGDW